MRQIILNAILQFLLEKFGVKLEAKASVLTLKNEQLAELLEYLNKEHKINLTVFDINSYAERYSNVSADDLAAIVFAKSIG